MNVYKITYSKSDDYSVELYTTCAETVVAALDELRRCVGRVDRICKLEKAKEPDVQVVIMTEHFSKVCCKTSTILVYYMDATESWIVEDGDNTGSFNHYIDAEYYAKGVLIERHAKFNEV